MHYFTSVITQLSPAQLNQNDYVMNTSLEKCIAIFKKVKNYIVSIKDR